MVEIKLDPKANALYIKFKKSKVYKTISEGDFIADLNKKGEVIGIEVLNYSDKVKDGSGKYSIHFAGIKRTFLVPA